MNNATSLINHVVEGVDPKDALFFDEFSYDLEEAVGSWLAKAKKTATEGYKKLKSVPEANKAGLKKFYMAVGKGIAKVVKAGTLTVKKVVQVVDSIAKIAGHITYAQVFVALMSSLIGASIVAVSYIFDWIGSKFGLGKEDNPIPHRLLPA